MSQSVFLSLVRLRPLALRLAPWTVPLWLSAFLVLFAAPCCCSMAAAEHGGAGAQSVAATGVHEHGAQHDSCLIEDASWHVLPALATVATPLRVKVPALYAAFAPSLSAAAPPVIDRIGSETGPPGLIAPIYLATRRLRI